MKMQQKNNGVEEEISLTFYFL